MNTPNSPKRETESRSMSAEDAEILGRFFPFVSDVLHCVDTEEGMFLPLEDIKERWILLLEDLRLTACPPSETTLHKTEAEFIQAEERQRFALCAWADEKMLQSSRSDASQWFSHCLQAHYFKTTQGGKLFFEYFEEELDKLSIPQNRGDAALTLIERLHLASGADASGKDTLRVFAFCLLLGFRGVMFKNNMELENMRKVCRELLRNTLPAIVRNEKKKEGSLWLNLAPFLWILFPIAVCAGYHAWCAGILANLQISGM